MIPVCVVMEGQIHVAMNAEFSVPTSDGIVALRFVAPGSHFIVAIFRESVLS